MDLFEKEILTIDVGGRLRQLRTERGKSMRALARESGLSTNALSMIERSRTSPSVSTLYKISSALEIPITSFFRLEPSKQDVVFSEPGQRKRVKLPEGVLEGLGGELFIGSIDPLVLELEVGAESGPFGIIYSGSEFVICLNGLIEYEVEEEKYEMAPGSSLLFKARLLHRCRNIGDEKARVLIVHACFEYGERPGEYHLSSGLISQDKTDSED